MLTFHVYLVRRICNGAYDDDDWCRDGPFALSRFNGPKDVVMDCNNNILVADAGNHIVRTIQCCGVVRTITGSTEQLTNGGDVEDPQIDGKGASIRFNRPSFMLFDHDGTILELDNNNATCVRRVRKAPCARPLFICFFQFYDFVYTASA